jgi:hypothetical protein
MLVQCTLARPNIIRRIQLHYLESGLLLVGSEDDNARDFPFLSSFAALLVSYLPTFRETYLAPFSKFRYSKRNARSSLVHSDIEWCRLWLVLRERAVSQWGQWSVETRKWTAWPLKMELTGSAETSINKTTLSCVKPQKSEYLILAGAEAWN